MRTIQGDLLFSINGESQGIAAVGIQKPNWAVVSLYEKCTQVSICSDDRASILNVSSLHSECFESASLVDVPAATDVVATASTIPPTYDIDNFIPNFQDNGSMASITTASTCLIVDDLRNNVDFIACGMFIKFKKKNIKNVAFTDFSSTLQSTQTQAQLSTMIDYIFIFDAVH